MCPREDIMIGSEGRMPTRSKPTAPSVVNVIKPIITRSAHKKLDVVDRKFRPDDL